MSRRQLRPGGQSRYPAEVSEQQLWLFAESKPLRERLGDAFFKQVPKEAGVYIMRDGRDRVLYVGQSGNLRHRLCSYKNVRPEKDACKLVRLVQAVEKITWETCENTERARLRENELLRQYRPKFNSVNTRPEAYGFIGFHATSEQLELFLTLDSASEAELYGAFKGLRWTGYSALLRLLLRVLCQCRVAEEFPLRLLARTPPRRYQFQLHPADHKEDAGALVTAIRAYLEGYSGELVDHLERQLPQPESLPPFWRSLLALDLQSARDFFERGPRRNRLLRERHGIQARLIAPAALDDLMALRWKDSAGT